MALTQDEIKAIVDKAENIRVINITEFFTMLLEKANEYKARIS